MPRQCVTLVFQVTTKKKICNDNKNGSRSHKNKQFLDKLNEAVTELTDENVTGTQN
jgi:hypothetical protein